MVHRLKITWILSAWTHVQARFKQIKSLSWLSSERQTSFTKFKKEEIENLTSDLHIGISFLEIVAISRSD